MFKIVQNPTYTWPVTLEIPTDGGKTEKATFDAEFKRLTQSRVEEIRASVERGEMRDIDLAREAMVGCLAWSTRMARCLTASLAATSCWTFPRSQAPSSWLC